MSKSDLDQVDPKSRKFINWTFQETDQELINLINHVTEQARVWLTDHMPEFREKLRAKMIKGALEHGQPLQDVSKIDKQLEDEYIDLIGWTQVKKYNNQKV